MTNQDIFEKNIRFLLSCNPRLQEIEQDIRTFAEQNSKAHASACKKSSEDLQTLVASKITLLGYSLHRIRDQDSWIYHSNIRNRFARIAPDEWFDLHEDVHLSRFLASIWEAEEKGGINNEDNIRAVIPQVVSQIIVVGVFSFAEIDYLIKNVSPKHILFLFQEWEHMGLTFLEVDWEEYARELDRRNITYEIAVADSEEAIRAHALKYSLLAFEHSLLYQSKSPISASLEDKSSVLYSRSMADCIAYLGYTIDEYNMIINTVKFLKNNHVRRYRAPREKIGGKYVVCGSGPSLDKSLPMLAELQKDHIIVSCGSNFKFLVDNHIRVDFLVLIERADEVYDVYKEYMTANPATTTRLVVSSTCHSGLSELFQEAAVFFRPALTPLALFCDFQDEIIPFEGPQAVNGGLGFVAKLQPDRVCLVGVDLGSSTKEKQRSTKVLAFTERKLDIEVPGNLCDTAYTESGLLDVKRMLELCISSYKLDVANLSDGVLIAGAEPYAPKDISLYKNQESSLMLSDIQNRLAAWWVSLRFSSQEEVMAKWQSKDLRGSTSRLSRNLVALFSSDQVWFPDVLLSLDKYLVIDGSLSDQVPVRIMRGAVYKSALALSQSLIIALKANNLQTIRDVGSIGRQELCKLVKEIERQIYDLCDYIDANLV